MENKHEYRIIWKREGGKKKTKRFVYLKRTNNFIKLLRNDKPWEVFKEYPHDYFCCDGHECGCGGRTVFEEYQSTKEHMPKLECLYLERRAVGEYERFEEPK